MNYKEKTIVATGCSHAYGDYLDQHAESESECHERSWVKKLERLGDFKSSINLAMGGTSNARSFRVIKEFVLQNKHLDLKNNIVMIGLTQPIRFELPSKESLDFMPRDYSFRGDYFMNLVGPWQINNPLMQEYQDFLNKFYGVFTVDKHTKHMLYLDMLSMHLFLKHFQIEHHFICFLIAKDYFTGYDLGDIPVIDFNGHPAIDFAKRAGFKVGRDVMPEIDCNHLDHDGNEFLAKEILERIRNGT